jgi:hypothetical protein
MARTYGRVLPCGHDVELDDCTPCGVCGTCRPIVCHVTPDTFLSGIATDDDLVPVCAACAPEARAHDLTAVLEDEWRDEEGPFGDQPDPDLCEVTDREPRRHSHRLSG